MREENNGALHRARVARIRAQRPKRRFITDEARKNWLKQFLPNGRIITTLNVGFDTREEREDAIAFLASAGIRRVMRYRDTQSPFALHFWCDGAKGFPLLHPMPRDCR